MHRLEIQMLTGVLSLITYAYSIIGRETQR